MAERTKVFEGVTEVLDPRTGAVSKYENRRVFKYDSTDDFIMFFTNSMGSLNRLDNMEAKVLFAMLNNFVTFRNSIDVSPNTRKKLEALCGIHRVTLSKSIKGLVEKEILVKIPDETTGYYLNPYVFGKGKWTDIVKLRQNLQLEFDFKKKEATATISATSVDSEGQDILENPQNYSVINHEISVTEKGATQDITLVENSNVGLFADNTTKEEPNLFNTPTFIKHKKPAMGLLKFSGILNGAISPDITAKDIRAKRAKEKFGANE
jgi:hypothetical protein